MLKKVLLGFLLVISVFLGLMLIPVGRVDPKPEMVIYLISNEIHTDIVIPVKNQVFDWETFYEPNDFKSRPADWIEIGWGDRQFYFEMPTWDKFRWEIIFDSLFLPDSAVIHVNYLNAHPKLYESARPIKISYETYRRLVEVLKSRFVVQNKKPVLIPNKGYNSTDNFYEAYGKFSVLKTCNVWTSDVLGEVGIKHPLWSPLKYGLEFLWTRSE